MFDRISGDLVQRSPTRVVVMTGGVGYEMDIPVSTYERLPARGHVELLTHLYVREDQMKIFGFATPEERGMFRLLLSVSGIGPRLALTILSGSSVSSFAQAVEIEDIAFLSSVKGIGRKRAERIVLELKDAVTGLAAIRPAEGTAPDITADAVGALTSLGYSRKQADEAVHAALGRLPEDAGLEEVVRAALSGI